MAQPAKPPLTRMTLIDDPLSNSKINPTVNCYTEYAEPDKPLYHFQEFQQPMLKRHDTVVMIEQLKQIGPSAVYMRCRHCQQHMKTRVQYESNQGTHNISGLFCMTCWCPCALIPYCSNMLKDVIHTCSKCGGYIGTYERSRGRHM